MSTHTAGQWTYQASAGHHDFLVYSETDGKDLALVRNFHEANARLISTAPDLLTALQDLVERCDGAEGVRADGSNIQTMRAHAAIEKATGNG